MGKVGTGEIAVAVISVFCIAIFAFVVPHAYNQNLEQKQKQDKFCSEISGQINAHIQANVSASIVKEELQERADRCT